MFKAAELHGGSLAKVAHDLQHPEESFWQKAGGVAGNTFRTVGKVLNFGLSSVAGAVSPDYTMKEARQADLMPSELLFGEDTTEGDNWYSPTNVLDFARRFAVDTIADPLTYLTFGVSAMVKVTAKTALATKLGIGAGEAVTLTDDAVKSLNKFQLNKVNALKKDFLKTEGEKFTATMAKKGTPATAEQVATHLTEIAQKTPDSKFLEGFMSKEELATHSKKMFTNMLESNTVRREYLAQQEFKMMKAAAEDGVELTEDQVTKNLMKINSTRTDGQIAEELLNTKLDPDFAKTALKNLYDFAPDYVKTMVDKGGVKVFGKTILSGQRIKTALNALPLVSQIDQLTLPVRNLIGRAFDASMTKAGRVPDADWAFMTNTFNKAQSQKATSAKMFLDVAKAMSLSPDEKQLLHASLEAFEVDDMPPADPILRSAYDFLTGKKIQEGILPPNVMQSMSFIQRSYAQDLKRLREAGKNVSQVRGYGRRLLVQTDAKNAKPGIAKSLFREKELQGRGQAAFKDLEGNRVAGFVEEEFDETGKIVKVTDQEGKTLLKLKQFNKEKLRSAIQTRVDDAITSGYNDIDQLRSDIGGFVDDLQETFDEKTMRSFRKHIEKLPNMDANTKKYLLSAIKDKSPKIDVDKMIMDRLESGYSEGVKLKADMKNLSESDLTAMKERFAKRDDIDPNTLEKFNTSLDKMITAKRAKSASSGEEGDIANEVLSMLDLEKGLKSTKDAFELKQKSLLEAGLDSKKLSEILTTMKTDFEKIVPGSKRILDKIIARKQNINDIMSDINLERMSGVKEFQDVDKIDETTLIDELSGQEYKRHQTSFSEARSLGVNFETNSLAVAYQNSQEAIEVAAGSELLDGMARNHGRIASEAPTGWREVNLEGLSEKRLNFGDFGKAKNGEPIVYHPATAEKIEEFMKKLTGDETTSEILQAFDKIQNITKVALTTIFPMFHGRNAITNVFLNHLNLGVQSLNPSLHIASVSFMKKEAEFNNLTMAFERGLTAKEGTKEYTAFLAAKDRLDELKNHIAFVDSGGYKWSFGEMRQVIKDRVIAFNPRITGQFDIERTQQENIQELLYMNSKSDTIKERATKVGKKIKGLDPSVIPLSDTGRWLAQNIEDQARLVSFFGNLKKTGDVELAADKTKQFLFDYANITTFERNFMRRVLPFYTFARKNFELQVKTLLKDPGKIAQQIRGVQYLGQMISGEQPLSDKERDLLPAWMQSSIAPVKSRKGSEVEIFKGIQIPYEAFVQQATPKGVVDMVSPLLKYPFELTTGYSVYNGRPISELTKADAFSSPLVPDVIKDFIGFDEGTITTKDGEKVKTYRSLRPWNMYALAQIPVTSRAMSLLGKIGDGQSMEADKAALYTLTGIDVQDFDFEVEQAKREKEMKTQLESMLQELDLGYSFKRFTLKE